MNVRLPLIAAVLAGLAACAPDPGSTAWCEQKKDQPKTEWSMEDAGTFAKHCFIDSTTVGSEEWCKNLKEKPKGDWTAEEAGDYTQHCVM